MSARRIIFLFGLLLLSLPLWMQGTLNPIGWAVVEITGAITLFAEMKFRQTLCVPEKSLRIFLLLFILWSSLTIAWTANFHSTQAEIYKGIFMLTLILAFLNDMPAWKEVWEKGVPAMGVFLAAIWIFFPDFRNTWLGLPNLLGGVLASAALFSFADFLSSQTFRRWLHLAGGAFITAALFLIGALGPVLALSAGLLILVLFHGKENRNKATSLVLVLALFLAASWVSSGSRFGHVWDRIVSDPHKGERLQIWMDSLDYFRYFWMRGSGWGTFVDVYPQFKTIENLRVSPYAHNEWLNLACETGLPGILLAGGFLCFLILQIKKKSRAAEWKWIAVGSAIFLHSFVDFNLHYPPVLVLFIFSLASLCSTEEISLDRKAKAGGLAFLSLYTVIAALPGIAGAFYLRRNLDQALKFDPLNGLYLSQTGRMRDLDIAIGLEPRNVWYRRKAALFYMEEWRKSGRTGDRDEALRQYDAILHYAPNVAVFQTERAQIAKFCVGIDKK